MRGDRSDTARKKKFAAAMASPVDMEADEPRAGFLPGICGLLRARRPGAFAGHASSLEHALADRREPMFHVEVLRCRDVADDRREKELVADVLAQAAVGLELRPGEELVRGRMMRE